MTPAVVAADRAGLVYRLHRYRHDPGNRSYALEAAEALGLEPARVLKTLLAALDDDAGRLVVAVVPAAGRLDVKAVAAAAGAKRAAMAAPADAERVTGYVVGGISPLGQRRTLPTLVDDSALGHPTVYVSAGRRGLEIELSPGDLVRITGARVAPIAR